MTERKKAIQPASAKHSPGGRSAHQAPPAASTQEHVLHHSLIELQGTAGNAAVVALIQGRPPTQRAAAVQRKVAFAWRPSEVLRFDKGVYLAIDKFEQLKADLRSIRAECEEWNDSGRLPRADYAWLLRKLMRVMDFINEVDGTRVPLAKRTEVIEDIDDLTGDLARWREKIGRASCRERV